MKILLNNKDEIKEAKTSKEYIRRVLLPSPVVKLFMNIEDITPLLTLSSSPTIARDKKGDEKTIVMEATSKTAILSLPRLDAPKKSMEITGNKAKIRGRLMALSFEVNKATTTPVKARTTPSDRR
ncbi:MAG: hypothetical protein ACP5II_07715 [Infirmifilum sp.]|jgi:hypothetical protein|uniref:hypothetical protein n=1 Tax=Infirmifilum TaxID=2856573 RepID=UPI002355F215